MIVSWLLSNVEECGECGPRSSDGMQQDEMYHTYREDALFHGHTPVTCKIFGQFVMSAFATRSMQCRRGKLMRFYYKNIRFIPTEEKVNVTLDQIIFPKHYFVSRSDEVIKVIIPRNHYVNGHELVLTFTYSSDKQLSVRVGQDDLDLDRLKISSSVPSWCLIRTLVYFEKVKICCGREAPKKHGGGFIRTSSNFIERWKVPHQEEIMINIRSKHCLVLLGPLSKSSSCCRVCQGMTLSKPPKSDDCHQDDLVDNELPDVQDDIMQSSSD